MSRAPLSREEIIEASLRVASRPGSDGLTVRRLGEELDADPTAIYRYFRDKDELLLSVADRLLALILDGMPQQASWQDELRALVERTVAVFLRYPSIGAAMATRTTRRDNGFKAVERVLTLMKTAGLDDDDAVRYYRAMADMTLAFAGAQSAYAMLDPEIRELDEASWSHEYREVDPLRFPVITAMGPRLAEVTDRQVLDTLVSIFISAIETRAAKRRW